MPYVPDLESSSQIMEDTAVQCQQQEFVEIDATPASAVKQRRNRQKKRFSQSYVMVSGKGVNALARVHAHRHTNTQLQYDHSYRALSHLKLNPGFPGNNLLFVHVIVYASQTTHQFVYTLITLFC